MTMDSDKGDVPTAAASSDKCQVAYLHHLPLEAPLDLGPCTLWPYQTKRSEMITSARVREHIDRLFGLMLDYRGKSLKHLAVISPKGLPDFRVQDEPVIEGMRDALGALFLSTVVQNDGLGGAMTSDNFTLSIQNFQPGSDGWATSDGSYVRTTVGGLKLRDAGIRLPPYVPRPDRLHFDKKLLAGFLACLSSAQEDLKRRVFRSTRWVSYAYSNVEHFPYQNRILLLMIAFEMLADLPQSFKQDTFGEWLDTLWGNPKELKTASVEPWAAGKGPYGIIGWWGVEFYRMRNAIVHEGDPHQLPAVDSLGREFFGTGIYVFAECVKDLLRQHGHMPAADHSDGIIRSWRLSKKPDD